MGLFDRFYSRDDRYRGQTEDTSGQSSENVSTPEIDVDQILYLQSLVEKGHLSIAEFQDAQKIYLDGDPNVTLSSGVTNALQYGYPAYTQSMSGQYDSGDTGDTDSTSSNLLTREQYVQYKINEGSSPQQAENAAKFLYDGQGEVFNTETGVGQPAGTGGTSSDIDYNAAGRNSAAGDTGGTGLTGGEMNIPDWVVPPPAGSTNTQAIVTLTNPVTGETFTAPSGGYTIDPALTADGTGGTGNTNMAEGTGQQIITGSPQNLNETNVVDYMGVQAADPTLQPGMKMEDQFKEIEIKDAELQDYTKLEDADPTVTTPVTGEAETVTAPDLADTQLAELTEAGLVDRPDLAKTSAVSVSDQLVDTEAARGEVSDEAIVDAAQMDPLSTKVGSLSAAQIFEATQVKAPASRTLQSGEMVQAAADAQKASAFVEQIQAAQADPSKAATVQGQLENLMKDFDEGDTPAWAAGALRAATAAMAARGLGSSSLAGQAIVQAAMESALPIAQADAATVAQFESQNLSNRQQRAMLAAEQRAQFMGQEFDQQFQARVQNAAKISDIANINFSAQQQIALENARLTQTANLANLNNRQALVMAEAAQIANLESANLNNRQQAAVQNAQAFLQMDMANLSNAQQALMFDAEARVQALFSDQAAENTARNINAASENELAQFYAELSQSVVLANTAAANANSQFNATTFNQAEQFAAELGLTADTFNAEAINDRAEFTAEMANDVAQFNATMKNNREQFNVSNQIAIDANNIQWRRDVNTSNTAAENASVQFDITNMLGIQESALNNIWNHYDSLLNMAWQSEESSIDRTTQILLATMSAEIQQKIADEGNTTDLIGDLFKAGTIFLGSDSGSGTRDKILDLLTFS